MSVESPRTFLTFLAAVLGASTSATFGELASVLLPLATLIVGTLPDAASSLVLAAQISHNDSCPVLHIGAVVAHSELLHKREEVEIIREDIFLVILLVANYLLFFLFFFRVLKRSVLVAVKQGEVFADLQSRYEVALLEVGTQAAVLGDISKQLERHQNVLLARHCSQHLGVGDKLAVEKITRNGADGGERRL
jgi:hypothetical protein